MHPLSIFPTLLSFGLIAPLLLRVAVGLFILYLGLNRYKKPYAWSSIIYVIVSIFIILGLYTQIAVIVGIILVKLDFLFDKKQISLNQDLFLYSIVITILISLLFTGPGFLAFDLPL